MIELEGDNLINETKIPKNNSSSVSSEPGLYISGDIHGVDVSFLVDSGACVSIISSSVYNKIPLEHKPKLETSYEQVTLADGRPMENKGHGVMKLKINDLTLETDIWVADICCEGIIGLDFFRKHECKLDFSHDTISIGSTNVNCKVKGLQQVCCRVLVNETLSIPSGHEMIIQGKLSRVGQGQRTGLIEGTKRFSENQQLAIGRSLVTSNHDLVPVRVMNAMNDAKLLRKGTTMALLYPVEIFESSNESLEEGCSNISHICQISKNEETETVPEHLKTLYENTCELLDVEQSRQVRHLLNEFSDVFVSSDKDIGRTGIIKHEIETGNARPIKHKPRRLPLQKSEEADKQIKEMLEKDLIEPSCSPWSAPITLVKKKDDSYRFCIDYRSLNNVTVKDAYPLPRIDDSLDTLRGSEWFSTMDLASGFWQVEMKTSDKPKTAFATKQGLFQFKVMPFGLCNSSSTFERLMETVLRGLQWQICLIYMDDIIVFGTDFNEELHRLKSVFSRLRDAGLKLKPKKCKFFQKSVPFLGHIVSNKGVATDPEKINSVKNWPIPTSVTEVRSFLGLASYYRRFIKGFAGIASPLHKLTEKGHTFLWDDKCNDAFAILKDRLISSPILAYPNESGRFILDTDACDISIGAVLSQEQGDELKVIAYASKSLSKSEKNYCVTRKELLAVVTYCKYFQHYLYGQKFLVRSDHGALKWLFRFKDPQGQTARWLEVLGTYNFDIEHRPGRQHGNADAVSRIPCRQCGFDGSHQYESDDNFKVRTAVEGVGLSGRAGANSAGCSIPSARHPPFLEASSVSPGQETEFVNELHDSNVTQSSDVSVYDLEDVEVNPKTIQVCTMLGCLSDEGSTFREAIEMAEWNSEFLRNEQLADENIKPLIEWLEQSSVRPSWEIVSMKSSAVKNLWSLWDLLCINDGVLFKKYLDDFGKITWHLIVPRSLCQDIFQQLHDAPTAGHLGINKTLHKVKSRFYWPTLKYDVEDWCKSCEKCAQRKPPIKKCRANMKIYQVGSPMERIATDLLGPLPLSDHGNRYIVVVADYFTKWTEAYALPNQEA